ncbi:unnamed protein product [Urochloa decumbens]|uniref:Uncharacterized protein n=1 Tax=Urochloa decumbens TaxID=240449 RepID=A0ABC9E124_9POAL
MLEPGVLIHQEDDSIGEVVNVQELTQRRARAPDDDLRGVRRLGLVEPADERGQDVGVLRVEVVLRAVEVGRHGGDGVEAVLDAVGLAHLDAGDLGDGVPLVGGLERAGEERALRNGLRREFRVDAGGAQEEKLADGAAAERGVDDVGLDLEVGGDEVGGEGGVGVDAADLGGRQDNVAGLLRGEEGLDVGLAGEVELGVGAGDDGGEAEGEEVAKDRGPDEAPVARHEDLGVLVGEEGRVRICGERGSGGASEVSVAGRSGLRRVREASGGLPAAVTVPMSPEGWTEVRPPEMVG